MIDLKVYQKLQTRVTEQQRETDKAQGALEELKRQLKKEFGCDNVREAKTLLAELEQEQEEAERAFTVAMEEFETQFGETLL